MSLKNRIQEDVKAAMRATERERLGTLRLILAAIKQREVDERITLDDAQVLSVLEKMVKQRRDSIAQFEAGHRRDLADAERAEIDVLSAYRPTPLSEAELDRMVAGAVARVSAAEGKSGTAIMAKVIASLKAEVAGRADMGAVSGKVKSALAP